MDENENNNSSEGAPPPSEGNEARTFTQDDVNRFLAEEKRKLQSRYEDYDALREKAQNWDQVEQASKTEYERLQESFEATRREAEASRAESIRYKAAATYGISADHFDLLGSGTEDEISARAEKIAALLAAQTQPPATPPAVPQRRPVEQMRPGATPSDAESQDDVLYAQLFGK